MSAVHCLPVHRERGVALLADRAPRYGGRRDPGEVVDRIRLSPCSLRAGETMDAKRMVRVASQNSSDEAEHLADVTEGFGDFGRVSPALLVEHIAVPDLGERGDQVVKDDRCGGTIAHVSSSTP